ncbi:hypothetical protein ACPA5B_00875 [Pseudomonas solani]|uniref:hypothetical protein n=1 Tax=Pseudomonas solani TaxID=2731552 RepID=UPI003C2DDB3A
MNDAFSSSFELPATRYKTGAAPSAHLQRADSVQATLCVELEAESRKLEDGATGMNDAFSSSFERPASRYKTGAVPPAHLRRADSVPDTLRVELEAKNRKLEDGATDMNGAFSSSFELPASRYKTGAVPPAHLRSADSVPATLGVELEAESRKLEDGATDMNGAFSSSFELPASRYKTEVSPWI